MVRLGVTSYVNGLEIILIYIKKSELNMHAKDFMAGYRGAKILWNVIVSLIQVYNLIINMNTKITTAGNHVLKSYFQTSFYS